MSRLASMSVFAVTALALMGGIHFYLYARLLRDTAVPQPFRRLGLLLLVGLCLAMPVAMILRRVVGGSLSAALALPGFVWMGAMLLLFFAVLGADLVRGAVVLGAKLNGGLAPAARLGLARWLFGGGATLAIVLSAVALVSAAAPPAVRRVDVPVADLPPALDGLKIVQLTDLHLGELLDREFLADVVARSNALEPDLIAITGDLVDAPVELMAGEVAPLAELRAPLGVFFVTGNHETYAGAAEWCAELERLGVRVLHDETVTLERGGARLDVLGVDDAFGRQLGEAVAVAARGRSGAPSLLLVHQPAAIHQASRLGIDVVLSGHTHGGQIWPFSQLVKLQQPALAGLSRWEKTYLYVSRGTGYWGPPMRLFAPAEITLVTLRAPSPRPTR